MSLQDIYKNAGVVMKPAAMKDGKLYSQQPHSGAGDFNFSRADGVQTRINKHGLIETVADNVPRLSYDLVDGKVSDCPHLLLEPSRTNVALYSENIAHSSWVKQRTTITSNQAVSPDGSVTADKITGTGTGTSYFYDGFSVTSGTVYTISIFAKKIDVDYFYINNFSDAGRVTFNLDSGTVHTPSTGTFDEEKIESYGNGWYRLSVKYTSTTTSSVNIGFYGQISDLEAAYVWGVQIEQGIYPTSYIPTSGSTETRQAETCNGSGNSETFNDSEGVLFAEIAALGTDGITKRLAISDSSNSYIVRLEFRPTENQIYGVVYIAPSNQAVLTHTVSDWTDFNKVAVKYKENDFSMWINGTQVSSDVSGNTSSGLNDFSFDAGNGSNDFYGKVKELSVFNETLTDEQLQLLTTP